jgi:hypothetical protein
MRAIIILAAVVMSALPANAQDRGNRNPLCGPELEASRKDIAREVARLEDDINNRNLDRRTRRVLRDDVDALQQALAAWDNLMNARCAPPTPAPTPPQPRVPQPMAHAAAQALNQALRQTTFARDMLSTLQLGVQGQCVSSAQAAEFLQPFAFDSDRMKALDVVAPLMLRDHQEVMVPALWSFASGRRAAWASIRQTARAPTCVMPVAVRISDEQLGAVVGSVSDVMSGREKREFLLAGIGPERCLTSTQAIMLVGTQSFDSDKRDLIVALAPMTLRDGGLVSIVAGMSGNAKRDATNALSAAPSALCATPPQR